MILCWLDVPRASFSRLLLLFIHILLYPILALWTIFWILQSVEIVMAYFYLNKNMPHRFLSGLRCLIINMIARQLTRQASLMSPELVSLIRLFIGVLHVLFIIWLSPDQTLLRLFNKCVYSCMIPESLTWRFSRAFDDKSVVHLIMVYNYMSLPLMVQWHTLMLTWLGRLPNH